MCMAPQVQAPAAPIVPESVKRVASDQRRVVADNTAAASAQASATNKSAGSSVQAPTQKKSLLGA